MHGSPAVLGQPGSAVFGATLKATPETGVLPGVYVALFRGVTGTVSRLIRWQTRSRYSHAALVFDRAAIESIDPQLSQLAKWHAGYQSKETHRLTHRYLTVEAREFCGVRATEGIVLGWGSAVDLFSIKGGVAEVQLGRMWSFARQQVGKPYDYKMVGECVNVLRLRAVFDSRYAAKRQEDRKSAGKWFCSEFAFAVALKAGIALLRDTEPFEVAPGLLARSPLLDFRRMIE